MVTKFNNLRHSSSVDITLEDFPPYLVATDTGEEIIMLPESDRYRDVPASAYDLTNQLKEGISLEQCPTYIALAGVHGADVATRLADAFRVTIESRKLAEERAKLLNPINIPHTSAAPSSVASD